MPHSYFAFAIPFFLFFMGAEYLYSKRKGKSFFHFAESVANINVGIAERLMDIFTMVPFYYFFVWVHDHFALFDLKANAVSWVLLFLLTDLVWYWYHRCAHEINILWAAHIVHHQSEDFNYTVSARITVFQAFIRCLFWGVLPFIGFPPEMITVFLLIHGIYPFFIHTQAIGKLGWIEKIFVTPSHHRVHHSSNENYLDKNYGDVLIIWDKMFGTFTEENEQPVYGLTKPLKSYSFLWQHFHYLLELYVGVKRAKGFKNKWKVLFGKPETADPRIRTYLEKFFLKHKVYLQPTRAHKHYIIFQTMLSLLLLFCTIFFYEQLSLAEVLFLTFFLMISLVNTGAILEQRSWIFYLENIRLAIPAVWIWWQYPNGYITAAIVGALIFVTAFFRPMERKYKELLYR